MGRYAELQSEVFLKRDMMTRITSTETKEELIHPLVHTYMQNVLDHLGILSQRLDVSLILFFIHSRLSTSVPDMPSSLCAQLVKANLDSVIETYHERANFSASIQANDMSMVTKKFAAFATIILPLTFVTSLWGMNVEVPCMFDIYFGLVV